RRCAPRVRGRGRALRRRRARALEPVPARRRPRSRERTGTARTRSATFGARRRAVVTHSNPGDPDMNAPESLRKDSLYLAETHEVVNVAHDLVDFNPYLQDAALQEAVRREGAAWAHDDL